MINLVSLSVGAIVGIVVAAAAVLGVIIYVIVIRNKFHLLKQKIEEAGSDIDVALTKRFDLLTKQLEIVKGYAKHEKETFVSVTEMRTGMSPKDKAAYNAELDAVSKQLNIMVEQYPQLRAVESFTQLQRTTADVEEHLQAARRVYNANINAYNNAIIIFPNSIIANIMKLTKDDYFEAEETKREDVKMEF